MDGKQWGEDIEKGIRNGTEFRNKFGVKNNVITGKISGKNVFCRRTKRKSKKKTD